MIVITKDNIEQLAWDKMDDMLPCVVQHGYSGSMQMLGYMNRDAVLKTLETGFVTFFSRSKQRLWTKGETSGHTLDLIQLSADCDYDAILAIAKPNGPTCHLGNPTCWDEAIAPDMTFLAELEKVLAERKNADPDSSYTAKLYQKGIKRIAQKVEWQFQCRNLSFNCPNGACTMFVIRASLYIEIYLTGIYYGTCRYPNPDHRR